MQHQALERRAGKASLSGPSGRWASVPSIQRSELRSLR